MKNHANVNAWKTMFDPYIEPDMVNVPSGIPAKLLGSSWFAVWSIFTGRSVDSQVFGVCYMRQWRLIRLFEHADQVFSLSICPKVYFLMLRFNLFSAAIWRQVLKCAFFRFKLFLLVVEKKNLFFVKCENQTLCSWGYNNVDANKTDKFAEI